MTTATVDARISTLYASGLTLTRVGEIVGMSRGGVKKRLLKHDVRIRTEEKVRSGEKNGRWSGNNQTASLNAVYLRQRKEIVPRPDNCERCGSDRRISLHHRDGNPRNDSPGNFEFLCSPCHSTHHRRQERDLGIRYHSCKRCGIDVDEKTPGCRACYHRHYERARYEAKRVGPARV